MTSAYEHLLRTKRGASQGVTLIRKVGDQKCGPSPYNFSPFWRRFRQIIKAIGQIIHSV